MRQNPIIHSLVKAGIPVYVDSIRGLAHNKVIILDQQTIITGSFNFSQSANTQNAENLLIVNDETLVARYEENWKRRVSQALPYREDLSSCE